MKNNIDTNTYRITPFTIYPLNKKAWVLQTTTRVNIINNNTLVLVLKHLYGHKYTTLNALKKMVNDDIINDIIDYLKSNNIICPLKKINFNLKNTVFLTNNEKIFNFYKSHYFNKIKFFEDIKKVRFRDDQLVVVILNPYNPEIVRNLYKKINNINVFLLLGFFYNFKFYLDNVYNSNLKLPNHFDHLKYIQSGIYSDQTNYTYQDLVNIIFEKDPKFGLDYPISWVDLVMLSKLVLQKTIKIFDLDDNTNLYMSDDISEIQEMDLQTYKTKKDSANYWEIG